MKSRNMRMTTDSHLIHMCQHSIPIVGLAVCGFCRVQASEKNEAVICHMASEPIAMELALH